MHITQFLVECGYTATTDPSSVRVLKVPPYSSFDRIPYFLAQFVNLQKLEIQNVRLESLENFPAFQHLICLQITKTRIRDISILSNVTSLQELVLDGNGRLQCLAYAGLHKLQNLVRLSLVGCAIESLFHIGEELSRIPNIRILRIVSSERELRPLLNRQLEEEDQEISGGVLRRFGALLPGFRSMLARHGRGAAAAAPHSSRPVSPAALSSVTDDQQQLVSFREVRSADGSIVFRDAETRASDVRSRPLTGLISGDSQPFTNLFQPRSVAQARQVVVGAEGDDDADEDADDPDFRADDYDDEYEPVDEEDSDLVMSEQDDEDDADGILGISPAGYDERNPCQNYPHYRAYLLKRIPQLHVLDGIPVSKEELMEAAACFEENFAGTVPGCGPRQYLDSILGILRHRMDGVQYHNVRTVVASVEKSGLYPRLRTITPAGSCPRQFEYHPTIPSRIACGTLEGDLLLLNVDGEGSHNVIGRSSMNAVLDRSMPARGQRRKAVLGIYWMRNDPGRFLAGADNGDVVMFDAAKMQTGAMSVVASYPPVNTLTSLHGNSTDAKFVSSGYDKNVYLFDFERPTVPRILPNLHNEHINVVKFSYTNPNMLLTSSFDESVKLWDIRTQCSVPLWSYKIPNSSPVVMACFSPNDKMVLACGVDNNVVQIDAPTGRPNLFFNAPQRRLSDNYTRAYYMNGGEFVIIGSSQESCIRCFDATNGKFVREFDFPDSVLGSPVFIQSLRGDTLQDFRFTALLFSRTDQFRQTSCLVEVDMLVRCDQDYRRTDSYM
eukprot:ANDGO_00227.mRNA.1 Histone acetyltransferase type B subunit 2